MDPTQVAIPVRAEAAEIGEGDRQIKTAVPGFLNTSASNRIADSSGFVASGLGQYSTD
jgi:hypothetical protein